MSRILFAAGLLLMSIAAGYIGGLMSQSPRQASADGIIPDTIKARQFILVDNLGRARGRFGTSENGDPCLNLMDDAGKLRSCITLVEGTPKIYLGDKRGKLRSIFALQDDGEPLLIFNDANGSLRCSFGLGYEGTPDLTLFDAKSQIRAQFMLFEGNIPTLRLNDSESRPRCQLTLLDDFPSLSFHDATGKIRGIFSFIGEPSLSFNDSKGTVRGIFGIQKDNPALSIYDDAGKPLWRIQDNIPLEGLLHMK